MKKLNIDPLFLLLSSIVLFVLSIYILNTTYSKKTKSFDEFKNNSVIIKKYNNLKNTWAKKDIQVKKINQLIKRLNIKNANITQNANKIKVKIKSDINKIDRFTNKLLNEKLNITKLKITKDELSFEVGLL